MDDAERVASLWDEGFATEGLGPQMEWDPVPKDEAQRRFSDFWGVLTPTLADAYGDEEEDPDNALPYWMSQRAAERLKANTTN